MSFKSFEERKRNSIVGEQNLAYAQSETNSHRGSSQIPLDHEDIQMEKRQANSDPPSYASKASSRSSLTGSGHLIDDRDVVTTNHDLNKVQEPFHKTNLDLDKNNNNLIVNNSLNVNLTESEKLEKKIKNEQFDSVIFKGIENKKRDDFQKPNKKSKDPKDGKDVTFLELYRFADCLDKILIFIGIICSLLVAAVYPIMFLMYGRVAGTFVDFKKYQYIQSIQATKSSTNTTTNNPYSSNPCFQQLTNDDTDFNGRMQLNISVYIGIGFACLLFSYLLNVCFNTAAERQIKRMRNELYKSIIRQDYSFFDKNTAGDLNAALIGNIETLKIGISYKVPDFLSLLGRAVACYIFSLVTAWKFSIVFLGLTPFMILATMLMVLMIKKYTIEEFKAYGKAGSIAQEALSSIRTVLSLGVHKQISKTYTKNLGLAEKMAQKKGFLTGLFGGISSGIFNCIFGIGIYYGVYLTQSDCNNYSVQNIMQSFFSIITGTFALGQALPFLRELAEAKGVAKKIFNIIDTKSQIDVFSDKGGLKLDKLQGSVDFESVYFHYPQRPEAKILKGLNLKIPAGLTVALVGSSGGGKSTVVSLLQRFYNPVAGTVKIDGHLIQDLDLNWLRSQMALVAQEPILFTTSIKENIRLGRLDATDEEIVEAAKKANAHNFIMSTTHNYDTQVGERGTQLSGGQKQRIAIARALIRNPKILLLDEATSALDNESEKIVQDALDKAKVGRTTIIIAHRLSTIRNADLIVALADGQFKEMGNHEELMAKKGLYYDLVNTQATKKVVKKDEKNLKKQVEDFDQSDEEKEDLEKKKEKEIDDIPQKKESKVLQETKKKFRKPKFKYERKLWRLQLPEDAFWICIGTIAQLVNGAIFPGTVLVFSEIYSVFTEPDETKQNNDSLMYMGILLGLAIAVTLATIGYNYAFSLVGARLTKRLRMLMFDSMLRQEIGFHDLDENRSSILSTKLASSVTSCKGLTTDKLSLLAQAFSGIGFGLIVAFILNWKLAFVVLCFAPIMFISGVISGSANTNAKSNGRSAIEEGGRVATETVENIKTIISLGRETHFIEEFNHVFAKGLKKTFFMMHVSAFFYGLSNSVIFFIQCASFGYGWYLIKNENLSITDLFKIYGCITFSAMVLGRVYSQLPDQKKALDGAKTAFRIIERKSKIDSMSEEGLKPDSITGEIKFENVHFHYPNRPDIKILKGLNLICKKGQTNALVGPSGCGKSTTIALLLRFYDVDGGAVYLDGIDIRTLNIDWLRSKIGLVSQEPTLFNQTIYQNVCYGDITRENIPISEVIDACKESNINNRIENLPDKYDTIVGTKGGQLSGGEKQRVAIARALIRKPVILLLDEATSALDTQSEQVVQDALDKAQHGRTCIVIAHRLSTIQNSDKISVVKDGVVLEEGNHSELMHNQKLYYKLQTQNH